MPNQSPELKLSSSFSTFPDGKGILLGGEPDHTIWMLRALVTSPKGNTNFSDVHSDITLSGTKSGERDKTPHPPQIRFNLYHTPNPSQPGSGLSAFYEYTQNLDNGLEISKIEIHSLPDFKPNCATISPAVTDFNSQLTFLGEQGRLFPETVSQIQSTLELLKTRFGF